MKKYLDVVQQDMVTFIESNHDVNGLLVDKAREVFKNTLIPTTPFQMSVFVETRLFFNKSIKQLIDN